MEEIIAIIARELNIPLRNIRNTIDLLEGGATVPFISRYRKEATGSLDEVKIETILDRLLQLKELQRRKEYILKTIGEKGALTDELRNKIESVWESAVLEDIYLPFKPKRKTRAEVARQKGLEPLAKIIMAQHNSHLQIDKFLSRDVPDKQSAIAGAKDIIAEWVNEDARVRGRLRSIFSRTAVISSRVVKGKKEEGSKYSDYFDFSEPLRRCSSHRLLAMRRGESEGILRVDISPCDDAIDSIQRFFIHSSGEKAEIIREAVSDSYSRLLKPSIENEFAGLSKREADLEAIEVFAANLKGLLLSAPLGAKKLMAIDPGYRTGCKVVILDSRGNLQHYDTIFPHGKTDQRVHAEMKVLKMLDRYGVEVIAIGSGTAGRATREFLEELTEGMDIDIYMVNEDGASVYSASEVARREFPDHDVTVRGAVSIGRRLMDPLSELVKIDPKSIGVGQYQHDVDQTLLKSKLKSVTESCVNSVGVNLNTASAELLTFVSGLGEALARNIVAYRDEHGEFSSRTELKKVPRLGNKAYEQCAGFLRIPGAKNPLDNSAVHPERYALVARMAADLNATTAELIANSTLRSKIDISKYISAETGEETLSDILAELEKPGRDPRKKLQKFEPDSSISRIDDLKEGMILPGIVANVTNFGCFVDLGIKAKGLVHISQLADKRVTNPHAVVRVQQHLMVKVISVDTERNRIGLSLKGVEQP